MAYYLDLFSPETYEAFKRSTRNVSGFRLRQLNIARAIHPGDKFICYMTKLSRWFGVLEVTSNCFIDDTPVFLPDKDPFVVRFNVKTLARLPKEKAIPIHEDEVWNELSFTRGHDSIVRAFEVEHTTAVYSGILRMADLLALQPNMDIKLHIVAPPHRRDKVFEEIQRPVFSLLEKGPLAEYCTFIPYDSLVELSELKYLAHVSDTVLEDYAEEAE